MSIVNSPYLVKKQHKQIHRVHVGMLTFHIFPICHSMTELCLYQMFFYGRWIKWISNSPLVASTYTLNWGKCRYKQKDNAPFQEQTAQRFLSPLINGIRRSKSYSKCLDQRKSDISEVGHTLTGRTSWNWETWCWAFCV